jgi:hypothetical protein
MKTRLFLAVAFCLIAEAGYAQRDSLSRVDTAHKMSFEDSIFGRGDSALSTGDMAMQFLAGEAAFNTTFFSLFGNSLLNGQNGQVTFQAGLGVLVSMATVPLAIHFTSELLGLKNGSLGGSMLGAFGGFFLVSVPLLLAVRPPTYLKGYLIISLPIITFAQLVYDLTMPASK